MAKNSKSKTTPTTVRFTAEERLAVKNVAGNEALGSFIHDCVLKASNTKLRRQKRSYNPNEVRVLLAQILAQFGKSSAFEGLKEISDLARQGALPLTPELEIKIDQACLDIKMIRRDLIAALGLQPD